MCIYIKGTGPDRQPEGERLEHEDLRAALEHRGAAAGGKQTVTTVTFSVEEWAVFGVPEGLTLHHYVIAGQAVFRPKPPTPERAARVRQRVNRAAAENARALKWSAQRQDTERGLAVHPNSLAEATARHHHTRAKQKNI